MEKRVEDNLDHMLVMDGDGKELEVMYNGLISDADANIVVCGLHVHSYINHEKECPELPQNIHDALQVHCTDETSIADDNILRSQSNDTDTNQIFCIDHHLYQLT